MNNQYRVHEAVENSRGGVVMVINKERYRSKELDIIGNTAVITKVK